MANEQSLCRLRLVDTSNQANAEMWKSPETIEHWTSEGSERERKRAPQWQLMAYLLPFAQDQSFVVADLGAGTGAAARTILDTYPHARAILTDFSAAMIEEGVRAMDAYRGRYEYLVFDMETDQWPRGLSAPLDAVVTSMCVHHLSDDRKETLFRAIFDHLAPGGWYLNYDPISTQDPAVDQAWQRANERLDPDAAHKRQHRTPLEQARHENHVRHMIPLEPQMDLLVAAGFVSVDVYWKRLDQVIYGGSRPAGGS